VFAVVCQEGRPSKQKVAPTSIDQIREDGRETGWTTVWVGVEDVHAGLKVALRDTVTINSI
jgi:hypothetical protein